MLKLFTYLRIKSISLKLNENFAKFDTANKESYILGDFSINLYHDGRYVICKNNTLVSRLVLHDV